LTQIQDSILNYWQNKAALPQSLSSLTDQFSGYPVPRDPENSNAYVYQVKSADTFDLCATFNQSDTQAASSSGPVVVPKAPGATGQYNWQHEGGYICFERTIDKNLYPPLKK